ncbi:helix-turn-helix transcriptional regulator [Labrenzia sp. PHM005]|uniref:ArsR/SmtB family transcription factor n=1 Tax=Labrenzia sp. PHM005 TaxID=2590016 RepID=UPI00113FFD3D|nr:metalloregulator ArsR/SmtB family transcription factor [Labrenzia sp. PHM005]QDG76888.1 helix-turn-helix transcriptional regulator [Labrenzia sp. PHM005]
MQQLDATFSALSDGTRRAIVARLANGEATLSDLAAPFDMSLTAVSKHMRVLSEAGLVDIEKRGRTKHCRLKGAPIKEAVDWLSNYEAFWLDRFDALALHLAKEDTQK